jgi:acetate kinase
MAAAMAGVDAVVYTGGVGENSAAVRERASDGLGFLGLAIDAARNRDGSGDRQISPPGALVASLVVAAREDLEIARQVRALAPARC